jgi:arginase
VIVLLSAPTDLGSEPPRPGSVPGAAKAPEALREAGLFRRLAELGAHDGGVVLPGRYVDDDADRPTHRVRDEQAMVEHARRLADRIADVLRAGGAPLVVDCWGASSPRAGGASGARRRSPTR